MYKPEKFWNRFAKRYNNSKIGDEAAYQRKLEITREYFTPESTVLEFGCGTGTTSVSHAPFVHHIEAIDVSEKMLAFAKEKAKAANAKNIAFTVADIDSFAAPEDRFDVIMGHSILHLLNDKDAVITKVFAMLKPGGVFVSSTVVMAKNRPVLNFVLKLGKSINMLPLVKFFSADDLEKSLTRAGFLIDHLWMPEKSDSVFIVAKKPE